MSLESTIHTSGADAPVPPPRSLSICEDDFITWLAQAAPGAAVEYHRGHLAVDRASVPSPFGESARNELGCIADRAFALAAEGHLQLVQERRGDGDFSYVAIKPNKPARAAPHAAAGNSNQPVDQPEHALGGA